MRHDIGLDEDSLIFCAVLTPVGGACLLMNLLWLKPSGAGGRVQSTTSLGLGVLIVMATACASGSSSVASSGGGVTQAATPTRNRDMISREELADPGLRAESVLDVVRTLRPQFISQRGTQGVRCKSKDDCTTDPDAGAVHVSIDGGRILPLDELANMHVNSVIDIQYLSASAAMQKFGGAAREGPVILIRTISK